LAVANLLSGRPQRAAMVSFAFTILVALHVVVVDS